MMRGASGEKEQCLQKRTGGISISDIAREDSVLLCEDESSEFRAFRGFAVGAPAFCLSTKNRRFTEIASVFSQFSSATEAEALSFILDETDGAGERCKKAFARLSRAMGERGDPLSNSRELGRQGLLGRRLLFAAWCDFALVVGGGS